MTAPDAAWDAPILSFPVVGIGASAGGLEAFTELLEHLPRDAGMAYVLVQHLDPTHKSTLPELLAPVSPLPLQQVQNGMPLERDRVYVIPPNNSMTVMDGHLRLTPRQAGRGVPMPINDFFRSLAERHGRRAIGVVLSGTATDGAAGLEAIKAAGGITFAQTEASAKFAGMPRSAIATGCVDFVLTPGEIAGELERISRHHYLARAEPEGETDVGPAAESDDVNRILAVLRRVCGIDFSQYKTATLRRRIRRRMMLSRLEQLRDYVRMVQRDAAEAEALCQDLLIRVTTFFRDSGVFDALKATVFPEIVRGRPADAPIRMWVPGCSTGEEAYSLAICLTEFLDELPDAPTIQLYGTDVNEVAILKARSGVYLDSITSDVSPDRLRRFFTKEEGGYRISSAIRDLCVFARQDLTRDPPFSHIDLISCRNVLIYLMPALQKRVFTVFHYALRPSGVLVLGGAESVGAFPELFASTDKKHRIYRKTPAPPGLLQFNMLTGKRRPSLHGQPKTDRQADRPEVATLRDLQKEADRIVLSALAPVGVVVTDRLEVIQFRGRTGPFLEPPPGAANFQLLKMARREFLGPLRAALEEARQAAQAVRKPGIKSIVDGRHARVTLEVIPFKAVPSGERFFVVLFAREPGHAAEGGSKPVRSRKRTTDASQHAGHVRELEQELASTKEYMQAIVQEQEATNEELRSSTEEIQSSYEELQSSNEELETAKEELQSANEELTTVNEELHRRTFDLSEANSDLTNFVASVNIPLIRVGSDLRIRRFTPNAERVLNVIATDVGRPIRDITLKVVMPDFEDRIIRVMDTLTVTEFETQDLDGRWWSVRIRPYRTSDHKIDGVVIAFVDIESLNGMGRAAQLARIRIEQISGITMALSHALTAAQVGSVLVSQEMDVLGADGAMAATRRANGLWEPLFSSNYPADVVEELLQVAGLHASPQGSILATRETVALQSPEEIAERFPEAASVMTRLGARAYLAVPLELRGEEGATLACFFRHDREFTEYDVQFVEAITHLGAQALRRTRVAALDRGVRADLAMVRLERDAATRVMSDVLSLLGDELKGPLEALVTSKKAAANDAAVRAASQVLGVVDQLRPLSQLAQAGSATPAAPARVDDVILDAIAAVSPLAAQKSVAVRAQMPRGPLAAEVDAMHLRQAVISLLTGFVGIADRGSIVTSARGIDGAIDIEVRAAREGLTAQQFARMASLLAVDERLTGTAAVTGPTDSRTRLAFAVVRHLAARMAAELVIEADGEEGGSVTLRLPQRGPGLEGVGL